MTQLDKKSKQTNTVLQNVANATAYNVQKMKALVRLADYMVIEKMVEYMVKTNKDLFDIMFGLEIESKEDIE